MPASRRISGNRRLPPVTPRINRSIVLLAGPSMRRRGSAYSIQVVLDSGVDPDLVGARELVRDCFGR